MASMDGWTIGPQGLERSNLLDTFGPWE